MLLKEKIQVIDDPDTKNATSDARSQKLLPRGPCKISQDKLRWMPWGESGIQMMN